MHMEGEGGQHTQKGKYTPWAKYPCPHSLNTDQKFKSSSVYFMAVYSLTAETLVKPMRSWSFVYFALKLQQHCAKFCPYDLKFALVAPSTYKTLG